MVSTKDRAEVSSDFKATVSIPVFDQPERGGVGLNLTGADTVII